jgi:methionine biosynthesis protein MetW
MIYQSERLDHKAISQLVQPKSTVLDLGCGSGELLYLLIKERQAKGHGIEIDEQAIYACVAKGLNVFHGDIDSGLSEYRDKSFDYCILNQSMQQLRHVDAAINDALRVGRKVIIGIPNFAFYKARLQLFFKGEVPVTASLPYTWYNTPNIHFLSIRDFKAYCLNNKIKIEQEIYLIAKNKVNLFPNLFAETGIFLVTR